MMLRVTLWMVRSGRHGEGENEALTAGIVGIGWADLGDLSDVGTTEDIRERAVEAHTAFTSKDVNATVRASRRHSAAGLARTRSADVAVSSCFAGRVDPVFGSTVPAQPGKHSGSLRASAFHRRHACEDACASGMDQD